MFVPAYVLGGGHPNTKRCRDGAIRKRKRHLELHNLLSQETALSVNGIPLENVDHFKYLGRIVTSDDDDALTVRSNIHKARARWSRVSRVLARDGANPKVSAMFYKTIAQSVLLFSSETWVGNSAILGSLEGFHHYVARRLSDRRIRPSADGNRWIYPAIAPALEQAGLFPMKTYLRRQREYLLAWITGRTDYTEYSSLTGGGAGGSRRLYWWNGAFHNIE